MLTTQDTNILIVLVLYNELLENSETFKSLLESSTHFNSKKTILVYDNSSSIRVDLSFLKKYKTFFEVEYISDYTNPGICSAYNYALSKARNDNYPWLLLLDQDTKLPVNYLQTLMKTTDASNTSIVGYIPRVLQDINETIISPFKINSYGITKKLSKKVRGRVDYNIIAINSGALISVDFLSEIGGFSIDYPLDMLDFWLFTTIYEKKKSIFIVDINIKHDLSVANFENNVSLRRYESILSSENQFYSSTKKRKYFHKLRLIKRLIKQIKYTNKAYFNKTIKYLIK